MPDMQAAPIIATSPLEMAVYFELVMGTGMSWDTCKRADNGALWIHGYIIELPGAVEAAPFVLRGMPCRPSQAV